MIARLSCSAIASISCYAFARLCCTMPHILPASASHYFRQRSPCRYIVIAHPIPHNRVGIRCPYRKDCSRLWTSLPIACLPLRPMRLSLPLPAPYAEQCVQLVVTSHTSPSQSNVDNAILPTLLAALPSPWSPHFSSNCLTTLHAVLLDLQPDPHGPHHPWCESLDVIARSVAPSCFAHALPVFDASHLTQQTTKGHGATAWHTRHWQEKLRNGAQTITLRQRIYEDLSK